jgi:translation elongation factor P (EF-P)
VEALIEVTDLRKGIVIMYEGEPYRVVDVNKHHMAMGRGLVRTKLKKRSDWPRERCHVQQWRQGG